jgi:hypothetical protein
MVVSWLGRRDGRVVVVRLAGIEIKKRKWGYWLDATAEVKAERLFGRQKWRRNDFEHLGWCRLPETSKVKRSAAGWES